MGETRVKLMVTIGGPPAGRGPQEPGYIVLAGTGGVLRRVRIDASEMADEYRDGRDGWLIDADNVYGESLLAYAEVDFDSYLEYDDPVESGDAEAPGFAWRIGPWTVLNVPVELLAKGG